MTRSAASQGSHILCTASRVLFFLTAVSPWSDHLFALASAETDTSTQDKPLKASDSTTAQNATESTPAKAATPEAEDTQPSPTIPSPSSSSFDDGESEDKQAASIIPVPTPSIIPTPINTLNPDKNGSSTPGILMANLTDLLPAVTDPAPETPSTDPTTGSIDPQTPSGGNATKETPTDPPSTDDPITPPKESGKAESNANPTDKATEGTKSTPASTVADSGDLTSPPSAESIFCSPLNTSAISVTYSNGTNVTLTAHAEGVLDITNDKNGGSIEVWDHDVGLDVNCTVVLPPKKEKKKKKPEAGTPTGTPVSGDGSTQNGNGSDTTPQTGANNGKSIVGHLQLPRYLCQVHRGKFEVVER